MAKQTDSMNMCQDCVDEITLDLEEMHKEKT